jgi:hypothetical protein
MFEPDVTLTDFAVAIECAVLVALLLKVATSATQRWLAVYLAGAGAASLVGGIVHGFVNDNSSPAFALLWRVTLLTIGVTTLALWAVTASLVRSRALGRAMMIAAILLAIIYGIVVLFVSQQFEVAILFYLPAVIAALAVLFAAGVRAPGGRGYLIAAAGLVLTIVAAVQQQTRIGIHPVYFNYNAVFHTLNGLSMLVIFWGARRITMPDTSVSAPVEVPQVT